MTGDWKARIIQLTEHPGARERKIDASFFPPAPAAELEEWERHHHCEIPRQIRSYLSVSNGLEAQRGQIWPVLPLAEWEWIHDECASPHPWIQFGESIGYRYLLSLGHSPSIYRYEKSGSDEMFFAAGFGKYLGLVFRGES